jgi:hypothetical protein
VLLHRIFAVHKERYDSSKLTTPGRRRKREKSVFTCGSFVKTGIHSKVHVFFYKNEPRTLDKVLACVNRDADLPH